MATIPQPTHRPARRRVALLAAIALCASLGTTSGPAGAGGTGTLAVTPNVALVDFQRVVLSGTGLEPGLHEWYQCRGGAVDASDCDGSNADFISVAADGTTSEVIYVDARIFLPDGSAVDCRTDPAGCTLGVGFMAEAGQWPSVALAFDPDAPLLPVVTGAVTPADGLVDDQTVTVTGAHLSFREEAFAFVCGAGTGPVGTRCDLDQMVRTVPDADGAATLSLRVRARFTSPLGGTVDCRATPTCEVVVSWGFAPPPDRTAAVPIRFAAAPPPTTIATTTTTVTTTTAPPAPAEPRPAQPSYTG